MLDVETLPADCTGSAAWSNMDCCTGWEKRLCSAWLTSLKLSPVLTGVGSGVFNNSLTADWNWASAEISGASVPAAAAETAGATAAIAGTSDFSPSLGAMRSEIRP